MALRTTWKRIRKNPTTTTNTGPVRPSGNRYSVRTWPGEKVNFRQFPTHFRKNEHETVCCRRGRRRRTAEECRIRKRQIARAPGAKTNPRLLFQTKIPRTITNTRRKSIMYLMQETFHRPFVGR